MALDNKLSNIIGTKIPQWIINQLTVRSAQNSRLDTRDNSNLIYLANKSAWVRLVSSVNVTDNDLDYFKSTLNIPGISQPEDLAKKYVLYGGTSIYQNQNSYQLRSGISNIKPNSDIDGAYGMLGRSEIQNFGFRPMPGISNVVIETQGRLGSVKQAIITIKCWDKQQLDIIDALYFKLGYTMFIEWGHTYYYPSTTNLRGDINEQSNTLKSTELSIIDPFSPGLTKESIYRQISLNSRQSDGNYDAMLGIVTNFNFSYNQEGGYDCTLRLMSLGIAGDYIKINNPAILPGILRDEVLKLSATLSLTSNLEGDIGLTQQIENLSDEIKNAQDVYTYINTKGINDGQIIRARYNRVPIPKTPIKPENNTEYEDIIREFGLLGSKYEESTPLINQKLNYDFVFNVTDFRGPTLFLQRFGARLVGEDGGTLQQFISGITIDEQYFYQIIDNVLNDTTVIDRAKNSSREETYLVGAGIGNTIRIQNDISRTSVSKVFTPDGKIVEVKNTQIDKTNLIYSALKKEKNSAYFKTLKIPYKGKNGKIYFISVEFDLSELTNKIQELIASPTGEITAINTYAQTYNFPKIEKSNVNKIEVLGSEFTLSADKERLSKEARLSYFSAISNVLPKEVIEKFFVERKDIPFNFDVSNVNIKIIENKSNILKILQWVQDAADSNLFPNIYPKQFDYTVGGNFVTNINSIVGLYNYEILVSGLFDVPITVTRNIDGNNKSTTDNYPVKFAISFDDTSLIQDVNLQGIDTSLLFAEFLRVQQEELIEQQNQIQQAIKEQQKNQQNELATQVTEALSYQSALEIILRTIQVKSLNKALYQTGKPDLEIGRKVYKYELWKDSTFIDQIFSNGLYSGIIKTLINNPNSISNQNYKTDEDQFIVNTKYGFASTLLGSNSENPFENLQGKEVDYKELLNAYVVPYKIDQEIVSGIKTNHPTYVSFGFLVTLLNHICTLYDTKLESANIGVGGITGAQARVLSTANKLLKAKQKPLIYIDYNPKLNFFLTNPQHLSTNPWVVLIPYEGYFEDYKDLFDPDVIEGNSIKPLDGSTEKVPLFNPEKDDFLSGQLPKIKDGNGYRGKLMNVLLNVDYLTSLVKDYSFKDSTNDVFLRPFLEQILSDINKYLGNFNALRLAYNDTSNTYQFVDDQYIPSIDNEEQIIARAKTEAEQNRTEIPLVGRNSIAKSLELKTEISSRLATMIAISSNSKPEEQVQNSVNGDNFGFLNKNYIDRYIPRITSAGDEKSAKKDGEKTSSMQFNQTITDFYSRINPAYSDVSHATSFYISKMAIQKNRVAATRSSMLIPISINLSLDGVGGLTMGQAFTVSKDLLPYNYYSNNPGNLFDGYTNQVGFAIVGLSHTIDNNSWTTSIRTQMIPVKDRTEFNSQPRTLEKIEREFTFNQYNIGNTSNANWFREQLAILGYKEKGKELANAGDISAKLASEGIALFKEIKNAYPKLVIEVTGGNDIFHLNRPNSKHKDGNGLDFILVNGNDQDIANVNNLIKEFASKYQISYIDEYDASKQSQGATGNHFHIAV